MAQDRALAKETFFCGGRSNEKRKKKMNWAKNTHDRELSCLIFVLHCDCEQKV